MNNLPIRLRAAREALEFTQQTLSMELNLRGYYVNKEVIKMYENGEMNPPVDYLKALVDYLDISPYFLLSDGEIVKTVREDMVFLPFFDHCDLASKDAYEKSRKYPTKYVAISGEVFEKIMEEGNSNV